MAIPFLPSFDGLHPLVVHFPIALLLVVPLFVVAGVATRSELGRALIYSALILIILGTIGLFVSAETGHAAAHVAHRSATIREAIDHHEDLAETAEVIFSALTVTLAGIVFAPRVLRIAPNRLTSIALPLAFLAFYAAGALVLANAAHSGGLLVHNLGVHANLGQRSQPIHSVRITGE